MDSLLLAGAVIGGILLAAAAAGNAISVIMLRDWLCMSELAATRLAATWPALLALPLAIFFYNSAMSVEANAGAIQGGVILAVGFAMAAFLGYPLGGFTARAMLNMRKHEVPIDLNNPHP